MTIKKALLISAPKSHQGKTVISVGLLKLLHHLLGESAVVGAKAGPDYIDTAYLGTADNIGLNLDSWGMRPKTIDGLIAQQPASHILIEGTMGLFDGSADAGKGSSADLAKSLGVPVLFVVDVSGMSQSVAALVHGFKTLDSGVRIGGVILNRVGSPRHEQMLRDALNRIDVPVLGAVPQDTVFSVDSRHLGLVQAGEKQSNVQAQEQWGSRLRSHLDLPAIENLFSPIARQPFTGDVVSFLDFKPSKGRVAIAADAAFRFCYAHWHSAKASVFSPLDDEPVPAEADCIFLPGGYPELYLGRLAKASRFWGSLRDAAQLGVPIYGECGGYMILGQSIQDSEGQWFETAGLLPFKSSFKEPKRHLGYRYLKLLQSTQMFAKGQKFCGHEFHYGRVVEQDRPNLFEVYDACHQKMAVAGHASGGVFGSYMHIIDHAHY